MPVVLTILGDLHLECYDGILLGDDCILLYSYSIMATIKKQIAVLNDAIEIDVPTDQSALPSFQLPVGWAGTVVLEATILGGVDYVVLGITPVAGGAVALLAAAAGMWTGPAGAFEKIRLRVSVAGAGGVAGLSVVPY
jgi:hypothetical protein